MILKFGSIAKDKFIDVQKSLVPYSLGLLNSDIPLEVMRRNEYTGHEAMLTITVKPRKWEGTGVFGCHFYNVKDTKSSSFGAFLRVSKVQIGGAADKGDLRNNDLIIEFGTLNADSFVDVERSLKPMLDRSIILKESFPILIMREVLGEETLIPLSFTPEFVEGIKDPIGCYFNPDLQGRRKSR